MCFYSGTAAYGMKIKPEMWTRPVWDDFKAVLVRLEHLDVALDQPDCPDPQKAAWMQTIEERLVRLESRGQS